MCATIRQQNVLIIDDFLANGAAAECLMNILRQAGAELAGIGIAVEKGQQKGGRMLREEGYRLESIAIIEEMDCETQSIRFREQPAQELTNTLLVLKS